MFPTRSAPVQFQPPRRGGGIGKSFLHSVPPMKSLSEAEVLQGLKPVLRYLDYRTRLRLMRVSKAFNAVISEHLLGLKRPVWFYVVYRRKTAMSHQKMLVQTSSQGPLFWEKEMFFITCCSCHFSQTHLLQLMSTARYLAHRIRRLCLVDSSVKAPFIPDRFFDFAIKCFPHLEFLYCRELNLEYLNYNTVLRMAQHSNLIRIIVHNCKGIDVLNDFGILPHRLMLVEGEIANNHLAEGLVDQDLNASFRYENRRAIFLSTRKKSTSVTRNGTTV